MRRERGQWYGPARVALVEKKVIWLVHAHRLVRASPQQLIAASLREWKAVKNTEEFRVPTRDWAPPAAEPREDMELPEESAVPEPEEEISAPTRRGSMDTNENVPLDGVDIPVQRMMSFLGTRSIFTKISARTTTGR